MSIVKLYSRGYVFEDLLGNDAAEHGTLNIFTNSTTLPHPNLFADINGLIGLGNSFDLGDDGRLPTDIYVDGLVRVQMLDRTGQQVFLEDNVQGAGGGTGGGGGASTSLYQRTVYRESPTQPATPTGNDIPAGWFANPPTGATDTIWASVATQEVGTNLLIGTWSTAVAWSATGTANVRYYILPLDGQLIRNGVGTLGYQLRRIDGSGDNPVSSGPVQLYVDGLLGVVGNGFAAGSDGYSVFLDQGDISGDTIIRARDGSATGQILDSEFAVDLADGTATITLLIASPEGQSFIRAPNGGTWSDTLKPFPITVVQGGSVVATAEVEVSLNTGTGLLTGSIPTPNADINITFPNNGTEAVTINAIYLPNTDATAAQTVQAVEGGSSGRDAVVTNISYSQPREWVQAPNGGAISPSGLTNDVIATFQRGGTILGQSGLTAALNPNTGAITVSPLLFDANVATGAQGLGTSSVSLEFTYTGGTDPQLITAPVTFVEGGSDGNDGASGVSPSAPITFTWTVITTTTTPTVNPAGTVRTNTAEWRRDGVLVASRTTTAVLNATAATVSVTTSAGVGSTTASISGDNSNSVVATLAFEGIEITHSYQAIDIMFGGGK